MARVVDHLVAPLQAVQSVRFFVYPDAVETIDLTEINIEVVRAEDGQLRLGRGPTPTVVHDPLESCEDKQTQDRGRSHQKTTV